MPQPGQLGAWSYDRGTRAIWHALLKLRVFACASRSFRYLSCMKEEEYASRRLAPAEIRDL